MNYYGRNNAELMNELNSSEYGLSSAEAIKRLEKFGFNILSEVHKKTALGIFLSQFKEVMIVILAIAAIISGVSGEWVDAIIILVIILLNAVVGFIQEYRAEKSMEALKQLSNTLVQVLRDGEKLTLDSKNLIPGDIVFLEAGNLVAADMRLIEAHSLQVDESSLTGESVPIEKIIAELKGENLSPAEQINCVFSGTHITNGRAKAIVFATGMKTELGKIAGMLQQNEAETPLQKRMKKFGKLLSYFILLICVVIFVSGVLRGDDVISVLLLSISLAVAAIPEALPALITVALSRGAASLARKNALVKKLHAVETLGSVSYICTDKTGTLTQNKMTVTRIKSSENLNDDFLKTAMSLNHDVQIGLSDELTGESTEKAILESVLKSDGKEKYFEITKRLERIKELPFDSDRKRMTTVHRDGDDILVLTKGASESIAEILSSDEEKKKVLHLSEDWASEGLRVLCYAYKKLENENFLLENNLESELNFLGLVGLIDPPREEVKQAIAECKQAGITTVMITGDHPETARAIAKQIGILEDQDEVLTGAQLAKITLDDFSNRVEKIKVYARVSPEQKLKIVKALQAKNHFVSMTGDGVNDAPSLKAANIGVAMGITGTDVSKEAAHMILLDDNFTTIVKAVKEGRRIFDNIRKFIKYIMTCNGAEIWVIALAPLFGFPVPLLPIHILWINLVTDGVPALALAGEYAEQDVMEQKPKPNNESLFSNGLGFHILWVGMLMAAVTLFAQYFSLENKNWQTIVFTVLSLSQLGHVLAVRSDRTFLYKQGIFSNKPLIFAVGATFVLQLGVIYLPFMNELFQTAPLTLYELGFCILMSMVIFHAVELEKFVKMIKAKKKT